MDKETKQKMLDLKKKMYERIDQILKETEEEMNKIQEEFDNKG
jgi:hypothetical protein